MIEALSVPEVLVERRAATDETLQRLREQFDIFDLGEPEHPHVTILATGSLGRGELRARSDLDVFLIDAANGDELRLGNLEGILLRANLIHAARGARFADFSGDGRYLVVHHIDDLLRSLGTREDESSNAFTARMLLLLESRPLRARDAYERCLRAAVDVYSRDAGDGTSFAPYFLINDIVRYWKTLCLNYEAKRHELHDARAGRDAERAQVLESEHRFDLLKLRFNRLWTCFNGLAYLLAGVADGRLEKSHVLAMAQMTPVERARELVVSVPATLVPLNRALRLYGQFLQLAGRSKQDVMAYLSDRDANQQTRARGRSFGDAMAEVIDITSTQAGAERFLLL